MLCKRCARIGCETPPGCEKCKRARERLAQRTAERSTSRRSAGEILFDWRPWNDGFGLLVRQINKLGNAYKAQNSKEAEKLYAMLKAWGEEFKRWHRSLTDGKK